LERESLVSAGSTGQPLCAALSRRISQSTHCDPRSKELRALGRRKSDARLVALLGQKADILNKATLAAEREADPSLDRLALDFMPPFADAAGSLDLQRLLQSLAIRSSSSCGGAREPDKSPREEFTQNMFALIAAIAAKDGDRAEQLAIRSCSRRARIARSPKRRR